MKNIEVIGGNVIQVTVDGIDVDFAHNPKTGEIFYNSPKDMVQNKFVKKVQEIINKLHDKKP